MPAFLPVHVSSATTGPSSQQQDEQDATIEVELRNGRRVRVLGNVKADTLALVLCVAEGSH